jgi:hypothetical protein
MSEKWSKLGGDLWAAAQPIAGTPAEAYLKARGISLVPGSEVLRFHPAADHPKLKWKFPALIAQVIGAAEPSYNFTFLCPNGKSKAKIDKAEQRRTLGSNRGGGIALPSLSARSR